MKHDGGLLGFTSLIAEGLRKGTRGSFYSRQDRSIRDCAVDRGDAQLCAPTLDAGNPLALLAGEEVGMLTAQQRTQLMANVGLDQPLPAHYVRYLQNLLRGDLGYSFQKNKPITAILADRLPWTLLLTVSSLLLSTIIGVTLGAAAAWQRGGRRDVGLLGFFVLLESLPSFWVGMLLVALFSVQFPIFPTFGAITPWKTLEGMALVEDIVRHLVLPLTTLTIVSVSGTFIVSRYSMLAVLGEDYIVVARSKGLRERADLVSPRFAKRAPADCDRVHPEPRVRVWRRDRGRNGLLVPGRGALGVQSGVESRLSRYCKPHF